MLSHQPSWWFLFVFFFLSALSLSLRSFIQLAQFSCKCINNGKEVATFELYHAYQNKLLFAPIMLRDGIANYRKFN